MSDVLPVSPAQREMWMAARLTPSSPAYRLGEYIEIHGPIDPVLLERALRQVVDESEALRARFVERDGEILQLVGPAPAWTFPVVDVSAEGDPLAAAERWMRAELRDPMRPDAGPLFTFAMFVLSGGRSAWYTGYHHLAADGASMRLVVARAAAIYDALIAGEQPAPSPFATLRELVDAEQAYHGTEQYAADRAYWTARLAEPPEPARLGDRRPTRPSDEIVWSIEHLPLGDVDAMRDLAARVGSRSLSLVPVAAAAAFLHRMTGQTDVVVGYPVAARPVEPLQRVCGLVANIVPLRLPVRPDTTVGELLENTRAEIRGALAHQRYRGSQLCQDLDVRGGLAGLFSMNVNLLTFDRGFTIGGHDVTTHAMAVNPVHDMTLFLYDAPGPQGLRVYLEGNDELYGTGDLADHQGRFVRLLRELAVSDLERPIGSIDLVDSGERRILLTTWGRGVDAMSGPRTVTGLFDFWVATAPDAVAVVTDARSWTYRDVGEATDRLAAHLVARHGGPERCIALALPRGVDLVVATLAVLKSGAAYLLLDATQPAERLRFLLQDARPDVLVTTAELGELDVPSTTAVLHLEDLATGPATHRIERDPQPDDAACVIYTSGSTGRPKGIVLTHRNLAEMVLDPRLVHGAHDRVLVHSPMTFDAFSHELWTPLLTGRTVVIAPHRRLDITEIDALITRHGVTSLFVTAALFAVLAEEMPKSLAPLKEVWTGGEAVSVDAVRRVRAACPDLRIVHAYGPAENTTFATVHPIDQLAPNQTTVPIGRPVAGTQVYVLDDELRPVPVGVPGELSVAGSGLARGYLNQPALTAQRFVPNPYGSPGERLYRTGDRVRWNRRGDLEFLGRTDDQVKIRGFRVEPGEIRTVLSQHPDVTAAAVVVRADPAGTNHLVAYVTPGLDSPDVLRAFLSRQLPDHMIPTAIICLDALPLTANGKLDHKSLPAPTFDSAAPSRPPGTPMERSIAALFAEVLAVSDVGADDDFFRRGGHSLLATRLAARARTVLGVTLDVRDVFAMPTVAGLAAHLTGDVRRPVTPRGRDGAERLVLRVGSEVLGIEIGLDTDLAAAARPGHIARIIELIAPEVSRPVTWRDLRDHPTVEQFADVVRDHQRNPAGGLVRPLKESGSARPLYLMHPAGGDSAVYAAIARRLGPDRPCYGLERVEGAFDISERARRYSRLLSAPVIVGGWSAGGLAAYETASRLVAAGATPGPVVLLDTTLPPWRRSEERRREVAAHALGTVAEYVGSLHGRPVDLDLDLLATADGPRQMTLFEEAIRRSGIGDAVSPGLLQSHLALAEDTAALIHYRPPEEPYPGPVVLFRATDRRPFLTPAPDDRPDDPALGWGDHCPDLTIVPLPGRHFDVVEPDGAALIADHLLRMLAAW
ncbi:amino acid adenylation domain-containing protein [Pseudonocardia xinjiangensis]|uniref:amino acid adenylation domain-containing protein n=1 Tax=Pseudonocardia xinjiangensis TaxID=75289 RepID=UPI003D90C5D0